MYDSDLKSATLISSKDKTARAYTKSKTDNTSKNQCNGHEVETCTNLVLKDLPILDPAASKT